MATRFKRQTVENSVEQDILIGAVVSTPFLEQTAPVLKHLNLIKEPSIRTVLSWCLDHYKRFNEAPGNLIQDIVSSRQRELGEEQYAMIESILQQVNARFIDNPHLYSESYYATKARSYIEEQSLLKLAEDIKGSITTGQLETARKLITNFNRVDPVITTGVDPIRDPRFLSKVFAKMKTGLIQFPYPALQDLFKDVYRGDILAVAGPAKRGKSFLMSQLGRYALHCGLNVAEFSYEMSDDVMGIRLYQNLLAETKREQKDVMIPYFDPQGSIEYEYSDYNGLALQEALEFQKAYGRYSGVGELRFFDHSSCGRKVSDIASALDRVEKFEDIKIDVVVIDYDILLEDESGFRGERYEGVNQIWRDVKSKIAQDRNTLVIFGSQYGKEGAKYEVGPEKASMSSRKFDYVSHWVSILQTESEKKAGLMRLSVLGRHDEFYQSDKVVCLQSLALARPILDARWLKDIPNYNEIVQIQQEKIDQFKNTSEQENSEERKGRGAGRWNM